MCVTTAAAAAALVAVVAVTELVLYHSDPTWLQTMWTTTSTTENSDVFNNEEIIKELINDTNSEEAITSSIPSSIPYIPQSTQGTTLTSDVTFLVIVAALGLLAVVVAGLLIHLCCFHIYISFLGLTTYEYIRQQRQQVNATTLPNQSTSSAVPSNSTASRNSSLDQQYQQGMHTNYCVPRPRLLQQEDDSKTRTRVTTTLYAVLEETFGGKTCCGPPTPPPTPQEGGKTDDRGACLVCLSGNSVSPTSITNLQHSTNGLMNSINDSTTKNPKSLNLNKTSPRPTIRSRWNCCVSVPDSPEEETMQQHHNSRCFISMCRHSTSLVDQLESPNGRSTIKTLPLSAQQRKSHKTKAGAKLRLLFKAVASLRHSGRSNIIKTTKTSDVQTPAVVETSPHVLNMPPLPHRRVISDTELATALNLLQQQRLSNHSGLNNRMRSHQAARRQRRISLLASGGNCHLSHHHKVRSPALSPIRESGLSNPASPSRQTYAENL